MKMYTYRCYCIIQYLEITLYILTFKYKNYFVYNEQLRHSITCTFL